MKDHDVIDFLKAEKIESPSKGAIERCIAALPEVNRKPLMTVLLRLQLESLPAIIYLLTVVVVAAGLSLGMMLDKDAALVASGIVSSMTFFLLGWHLILAETGAMAEIEHTCRYQYSQILLSRILCLMGMAIVSALCVSIPVSVYQHGGINYCLAMMLPTSIGALAAVLWASYISNRDLAVIAVYLVAALLTSYHLQSIFETGVMTVSVMLIVCFGALGFRGHTLFDRRIKNESYSI